MILFMDGFDTVIDEKTQDVIFSTVLPNDLQLKVGRRCMIPSVIDNVVNLWNKGEVDTYLLDEEDCSQDEREIIVESLYAFYFS